MNPKILIVEDNPLHMRLLEMTLKGRGYTLFRAIDGPEGLAIAEREHPDLILMDIRLPRMSGFEVARRIRDNPALNHIPIIALTAHAMGSDRESMARSGCDVYITKPIDTRELSQMVAKMLERKQEAQDSDRA
jgi:two-component system cell cycle response regulator DivK